MPIDGKYQEELDKQDEAEILDAERLQIIQLIEEMGKTWSSCAHSQEIKDRILNRITKKPEHNLAQGELCLCPKHFGDCDLCEDGKCLSSEL